MRDMFCRDFYIQLSDLRPLRPDWTRKQCEDFLKANEKKLCHLAKQAALEYLATIAAPKNYLQ